MSYYKLKENPAPPPAPVSALPPAQVSAPPSAAPPVSATPPAPPSPSHPVLTTVPLSATTISPNDKASNDVFVPVIGGVVGGLIGGGVGFLGASALIATTSLSVVIPPVGITILVVATVGMAGAGAGIVLSKPIANKLTINQPQRKATDIVK